MSDIAPTRIAGLSAAALLVALGLALGCTETSLHKVQPESETSPDNLMRVKGDLCIEPETSIDFPVKVLFLLDQSTSLQFTDPNKRRYDAVRNAVKKLRSQRNVEVAFIGFSAETEIANSENPFQADLNAFNELARSNDELGPATDYQGALATAKRIIDQDLRQMDEADRPRTRYVINFVTDGQAEPVCQQGCEDDPVVCSDGKDNDNDGLVDDEDPDCDPDSEGGLDPTGCTQENPCVGRCNSKMEVRDGYYTDFNLCGAYNQPRQIKRRAEDIVELADVYDIAGMSINSILLFTTEEIPDILDYDRDKAVTLLEGIAEVGDGVFRDVNVGGGNNDFLNFQIEKVDVEHKMRTLIANNRNLQVDKKQHLYPDSDEDGLADGTEQEMSLKRFATDTDGDGYRDGFEHAMREEGFDPTDGSRPATGCTEVVEAGRQDRDGDGLLDCEEAFLGTDPNQPDTDLDGIPDGLEFLKGTDPATSDATADIDFDGVSNLDEIRRGRLPDEAEKRSAQPISYEVSDLGVTTPMLENEHQDNDKRCYAFDIRRIPLVTTPIRRNRGRNRIYLRATQRPTQTASIAGKLRTACIETIYDEEGIKKPRDGVVDISGEALDTQRTELENELKQLRLCPKISTDSPKRSQLASLVDDCMGPKVEVGDKLLREEEVRALMQRYLTGNFAVKLPRTYEDMFPVGGNFDPQQHCYRPWEVELFHAFVKRARTACAQCIEEPSGADAGGADAGN